MSITRIFADDTSLSSSSKDTEEIKRNLEDDLDKIHDWSIKRKIDYNPNKTELLFIGNCPVNFEVNFNNISIKPISSHNILDLLLTQIPNGLLILTISVNQRWQE